MNVLAQWGTTFYYAPCAFSLEAEKKSWTRAMSMVVVEATHRGASLLCELSIAHHSRAVAGSKVGDYLFFVHFQEYFIPFYPRPHCLRG